MLRKISCNEFALNLAFCEGANYICGDNVASNSIGKTTALLLIDFAFGGSTYASSEEITLFVGNHSVEIEFIFSGIPYRFVRQFENPHKVLRVTATSQEELSLRQYTEFLKEKYRLSSVQLSFRDAVSLYSRIWGKRNIDPTRPLSTVPNESGIKAITRLIKLCKKYDAIDIASRELHRLSDQAKTLRNAQQYSLLPAHSKKDADEAKETLGKINAQIDAIAQSIAISRNSVEVAITPELLRLRNQRSEIDLKIAAANDRISSLQSNLTKCHIAPNTRQQLNEFASFFPDANIEAIEKIEEFHGKINAILLENIQNEIDYLNNNLHELHTLQRQIDDKFASVIESPPALIGEVNNLTDLIAERERCARVIKLYEENSQIKKDLKKSRDTEASEYLNAVQTLSSVLNQEIEEISSDVLPTSIAPHLELTQKTYSFKIYADSGTGKAYAALVIFDLAVLNHTALPFAIHDSVCLKNIDVETLNNIIDRHEHIHGKQIFISIDEVQRLGNRQRKFVESRTVLSLSKTDTLFGNFWKSHDCK